MAAQTHLRNADRKRLVNVLIAKSIIETVLIGAVAVIFFVTSFPPFFRGWGEAKQNSIAGWVVDDAKPWHRVEIQLFVDDNLVASSVANRSRPDVFVAGWSKDEWHGYELQLPKLAPGEHVARVYAVHASGGGRRRTLQLVGDPIRFWTKEDGSLTVSRSNGNK
jgi:hypothetical protein